MIQDKLESDLSVRECIRVTIDYSMEMLTFCVLTIYFQLSSDIYWKEEGLLMGSPLSPIIGNIQRIFWWNIISKTNHVAYLHTLVPLGRCSDTAGPFKNFHTVHKGKRSRRSNDLHACTQSMCSRHLYVISQNSLNNSWTSAPTIHTISRKGLFIVYNIRPNS